MRRPNTCRKNLHKMLKISPKPSKKWEIHSPRTATIFLFWTVETLQIQPLLILFVKLRNCMGQEQYDIYVGERLVNQTKSVWEPIKKNNLALFSRPPIREKTKSQLQPASLKNDCSLFSRLYVASQVRNGNLD